MYAGVVVIPLIVGGALDLTAEQLTYLVSIDILTSGIATLLQVWKNKFFGIGLPIVLGCTFTAVGPMISYWFTVWHYIYLWIYFSFWFNCHSH